MQIPIYVLLLAFCGLATSTPVAQSTAAPDSPASVLATLGVDSSLVHSAANTSGGDVSLACRVLSSFFPRNDTITATSTFYTPLYQVPWSETCWIAPGCIVTPSSAEELSKILKILIALKTKFATRSGGHLLAPGFNSIGKDGVLIALQDLNNLAMSADRKTATVGTGNRWRDVYSFVADYNVTIVGGREPMVGVGGFLLGGGLSFFYNSYGLGLDNVSRYKVVLTDGRIVDATPTLNSDLYKALKGGLSNFGIVTEFDLMTNDFFEISYEVVLYHPEDTPALLRAYANYTANETDTNSIVQVQVMANYSLGFYGYKGYVNSPAPFVPFRSLPILQTVLPQTNGTVNSLLFGVNDGGGVPTTEVGSALSHTMTSADFLLETYQVYLDTLATIPPNTILTYVPQGISAGLVRAGLARNGGNLLGLSETPQNWIDIFMTVPDPSYADHATTIVNGFVATLSQRAKQQGVFLPYLYPNNAAPNQKPLLGYGPGNFANIESTAAKWDPKGYMQSLQNDGYLIRNSQ